MQGLTLDQGRYFLKDSIRKTIDFSDTDQNRGVAPPPLEKPFQQDQKLIALPRDGEWSGLQPVDVQAAIRRRKSCRKYSGEPLTLNELSFLLWATQGIRKRVNPAVALRTVPSAGNRHAFETYLCVFNVKGLDLGIYRYLPLEHQLVFEFTEDHLPDKLILAAMGQTFVGQSSATFIWTALPQRMEWRYGAAAHKVILIDAGHVCQNLYLACEAVGAGTCAIAAYDQDAMDNLLRLDGEDEFTIYLAPVGKRVD